MQLWQRPQYLKPMRLFHIELGLIMMNGGVAAIAPRVLIWMYFTSHFILALSLSLSLCPIPVE